MRKITIWIIVSLIVLIILILALRVGFNGGEDTWIKDENGVYVEHGEPSSIPDKVKEQQEAISCAKEKYSFYSDKVNFSSQCLGTCGNYAVDIVHVPRTADDNKVENQCTDYREGKVTNFIELDSSGEIVRIVE